MQLAIFHLWLLTFSIYPSFDQVRIIWWISVNITMKISIVCLSFSVTWNWDLVWCSGWFFLGTALYGYVFSLLHFGVYVKIIYKNFMWYFKRTGAHMGNNYFKTKFYKLSYWNHRNHNFFSFKAVIYL